MPYFQQSAINTQKIDYYFNKPFVLRNTTIILPDRSLLEYYQVSPWNFTRLLPDGDGQIRAGLSHTLIAMVNEAMSSEYT